MDIRFDEEKYAKNVLKRLEKQLKSEKGDIEIEMLKKEIEKHKERYSEILKKVTKIWVERSETL